MTTDQAESDDQPPVPGRSTASDEISTACRVCGSPELVGHFKVGSHDLDRCRECGYVQVRRRADEDVYSDSYFQHAKYGDRRAQELENARRLALLTEFTPPGSEVLDAGCATGEFIAAAKRTHVVYGLDLSEYAVVRAREANPEAADRILSGRLEDSVFADHEFDAVCLWDVIEHIWDPVPVLVDLTARLRPGGTLFLSTPAIDAPVARFTGRRWPFMTPPEHLGFLTRRSLEVLFDKRVPGRVVRSFRRGKWANVAFIGYKIGRVAPSWFPTTLIKILSLPPFRNLNIYVPTGDVRYVVVRKEAN